MGKKYTTDSINIGEHSLDATMMASLNTVAANHSNYLTTMPSHNHDDRYYTESEANSRFVNVTGDTMSGNLLISKSQAKLILTDTGTGQASIDVGNNNLHARWILDSDDLFRVYNETSAFSAFSVKNNGNVGIGTTSPNGSLNIRSVSATNNDYNLLSQNNSGTQLFYVRNDGVVVISNNYFYVTSSQGAYFDGSVKARGGITDDGGTLGLGGGGSTSHLNILSSGNVGIGTTSPGRTLDVNGDIRLRGAYQFLEGESPTTRLRNMTALPGGYVESNTFNFRFDESATAYAGESHAIGGTISQTTGTAISDANLKRLFTYTADYINLNTHKDSNNNVVIELDGISVSNSANNQWKPYVFFHAGAGSIATMTIEVKNGAGNWETVENAIDCVDFYIRDGFYTTSQGVLKGVRFTFTNISNNSYLRMIGVIGKTHASYQWNVLKSGSKMFGDLDFGDTKRATFGDGEDLRISHEGNNSYIHHTGAGSLYMKADTGNIEIINYTNDSDIVLSSDNGSGGTTPYLTIDGSTTHAYFSNPGNVGIGTTSPSAKLDVHGSIALQNDLYYNGAYNWMFNQDGGNGRLAISYYGSEKVSIKDNGNVGIGTTSPTSDLHISDNFPRITLQDSDGTNTLSYIDQDGAYLNLIARNGTNNGSIRFRRYDGTTTTNSMIINSSGNVGIGTTSPSEKLHVNGNALLNGGLTISGSLSRGSYTSASQYHAGADNIVLKGNSSGVSGIFFESEKDGTNINHSSDFGFIQFHPYGTGTSGEANELIIGVSNDSTDHVVLNAPNSEGFRVRVGSNETDYKIYHDGYHPNADKWTTARTLSLSGDASGSVSWDGSANASLSVTVNDNSHNHNILYHNGTNYIDVNDHSNYTWFRNSHNTWVFQTGGGGDDWTQSFSIYLPTANSSWNTQYMELGQRSSNVTDGRYKGVRIVKRESGGVVDGDFQAGEIIATGNVGIGTTSPSSKLHVIGQGATFYSNTGSQSMQIGRNANERLEMFVNDSTGKITAIQDSDSNGPHYFILNRIFGGTGSNDFLIQKDGSTQLTINTDGNVGIGTTSPAYKLDVESSGTAANIKSIQSTGLIVQGGGNSTDIAQFKDSTGNTEVVIDTNGNLDVSGNITADNFISVQGVDTGNPSASSGEIRLSGYGILTNRSATYITNGHSTGTLRFGIGSPGNHGSNTKMTLNHSGNLGIGTTSPSAKLHVNGKVAANTDGFEIKTGSYGNLGLKSYYGSLYTTTNMYIGGVNGISYKSVSASAFNVNSDYRLKSNLVPLENAVDRVKKLPVHRFNWKDREDEDKVDGFLAHEVSSVVPEAVTGEKDAVREDGTLEYQQIDQSKIVPLLTAALQEAIEKIEQLENRIQTLENN